MLIAVLTGFVAGAIHVFSGIDHLVAISNFTLKKPIKAIRLGIAWGLGHSTGVIILSVMAIVFKDIINIEFMSVLAEWLVGFSLLMLGIFAVKKAFGLQVHIHQHRHNDNSVHRHLHVHLHGKNNHIKHAHAASGLGLLQGFAGSSHLVAIIPALTLSTLGSIVYLAAFLVGSLISMVSFVTVVSVMTKRTGSRILPFLVGFSGALSFITGIIWVHRMTPVLF